MNIDAMTLQELCDWHAEQSGWLYKPTRIANSSEIIPIWVRRDAPRWSDPGYVYRHYHPFRPTLDGADSAMPSGWWWLRRKTSDGIAVEWIAGPNKGLAIVSTLDTGCKITDLYRLSALARQKQSEMLRHIPGCLDAL